MTGPLGIFPSEGDDSRVLDSEGGGSERDLPLEGTRGLATVVIRGLRRHGDEFQLTQALAALCSADQKFARAFVRLVLETTARDGQVSNAKRFLNHGIPESLDCRPEAGLSDSVGSLGRVDLRFDGREFTLLVENKLHSGYGNEQLARYLAALDLMPKGGRVGVVAITRDLPTYGEASLASDNRWLGSVRWSRMREGLLQLPCESDETQTQWQALIRVMEEDGDLGTTKADADLIRAWALFLRGRAHLEDLLKQVWSPLLEVVRSEFKSRVRRPAAETADIFRRGKRGAIVVQRDQRHVYLGFRIPSIVRDPPIHVGFRAENGTPEFRVWVLPWGGTYRMQSGDRKLTASVKRLQQDGFVADGDFWSKSYPASAFLEADDMPKRLLELATPAIAQVAQSGVLAQDISLTVQRRRGGPPRHRKLPKPE